MKMRIVNALEDENEPFQIARVEEMHLSVLPFTPCSGYLADISTREQVMMVDIESARALQIFKTERHPSAQLQIGNSKEGLSVFALLNNCKTAMGKRLLRSWLLLPIQDTQMLVQRQKAVQFFVSPENEHAANSLTDFLKKVKDLPGIIGRMQRFRETPTDWMSLFKVGTSHSFSAPGNRLTFWRAQFILLLYLTIVVRFPCTSRYGSFYFGNLLQLA